MKDSKNGEALEIQRLADEAREVDARRLQLEQEIAKNRVLIVQMQNYMQTGQVPTAEALMLQDSSAARRLSNPTLQLTALPNFEEEVVRLERERLEEKIKKMN